MARKNKTELKTIQRFAEIIDILRESGPLTSQEVATELNMSKSAAHGYLASMYNLEYVMMSPDGYSLSLKFLDYGMETRNTIPIVSESETVLEQLAMMTDEAVYLIVEEHGLAVYVDYALGKHVPRPPVPIGRRSPLHCRASGKAILAHLPNERVEEIIETRGLPQKTEYTIDSPDELYEEMEQIRERGYAVNEQEANAGVHSIGAPVIVDNDVKGAVNVTGPANRITTTRIHDDISNELLATTNQIELVLADQTVGDD